MPFPYRQWLAGSTEASTKRRKEGKKKLQCSFSAKGYRL